MLIPEKVVKVGTFWDRVKIYYNRHPMICGYTALSSVVFCTVVWTYVQNRSPNQFVAKYRRSYIVIRPDDPSVAMIKKGPINLDY